MSRRQDRMKETNLKVRKKLNKERNMLLSCVRAFYQTVHVIEHCSNPVGVTGLETAVLCWNQNHFFVAVFVCALTSGKSFIPLVHRLIDAQ